MSALARPPSLAPPTRHANLFDHRPITRKTPLGLVLLACEVPECGCPDGPEPCPHIEALDEITLTLEQWGECLRTYDPRGYDGPPLDPDGGELLLTDLDRLAKYSTRALAGYAPRHPDDVFDLAWLGPLGVDGRRDVRAHGGDLCEAGTHGADTAEEAWARGERGDADEMHRLCLGEMLGWESMAWKRDWLTARLEEVGHG